MTDDNEVMIEVLNIASALRVAYYQDDSATIDKSEHRDQWIRMAVAAVEEVNKTVSGCHDCLYYCGLVTRDGRCEY